ncbi:MAG: TetR/AcrR family transcriptional regulator [Gammaproteobacteria bacterium]
MINKNTARRGRPKSTEKRSQILRSSADMFLSHGYDKTSMDAVANDAGVSKQTLYSHFANKEQLFRACITNKVEDHGLDLSWADRQAPIEDTLTRFGVQLLGLFRDPNVIAMHRLLMAESDNHPKLCQAFHEMGPLATKQMLADYLEDQASLGKIELEEPFESAELLVSIVERNVIAMLLLGVDKQPSNEGTAEEVRKRVQWFLNAHAAQPTTASH